MNIRDIAEFMAERFKPNQVSMDDAYSYRSVGDGLYAVDKTWRQHLIEQYTEDAEAFMMLMEMKRIEFREKPLV